MYAPASREKPPLGVKCPDNNLLGRRSLLSMLESLEAGKNSAFSLFLTGDTVFFLRKYRALARSINGRIY